MPEYKTGENALLVLVQGVNGFDGLNTSVANWKILSSGYSDHYAVLKKGEEVREWITLRQLQEQYRTVVEVWQRMKDDTTTYDELLNHADNLKSRIDTYRMLDDDSGAVFDANCTGTSVVTEQWRNNSDGPSWLKIDLYVDWSEQNVITLAE